MLLAMLSTLAAPHPEVERLATMQGGAATLAAHPCLRLSDQKQQSAVRHKSLIFRGQGLFYPPSFQHAVCKLLQDLVHNCMPVGWRLCSLYCACGWNGLKLTTACPPGLLREPASLQQTPEFYDVRLHRTGCPCSNNCRWGNGFLVPPIPPLS